MKGGERDRIIAHSILTSPTLTVNDFSHHPMHSNASWSYDSRLAILPSPSFVFDLQYIYPMYIHDVNTYTVFSLHFHRRQALRT